MFVGKKCLFTYPSFGTPDGYPEYTAHNGQVVDCIEELGCDDGYDQATPLFLIRASDGWEGHADGSELRVCKS